ncbi:MAG: histidinol-phosphate transaminase [Alphaproteobacteria bacterium]|nr:histidinol-phosphate transaminase [Alphaproteobacteria bacterium]
MSIPRPQPGILDITPYKGGESQAQGVARVIKLSSNETPLGPSPRAIAAYEAAAKSLHRYPDGGASALREALARHYGIEAERIVCSNGSDELIGLITQAFAGSGDEIVYSRHGFLMYPIAAKAHGAKPVAVPEKDLTADIDAMLAAVSDRTRIVFLANPNNPTGTYLPAQEVARLRRSLREDVLLVIDAAYAEYVSRNDYEAGIELVRAHDNVVMTRTFSKIYGLAGLRVGWAYAHPGVVDILHRVRGPFNVNLPAQAAAIAALADVAHVDAARTHNDIWLPWLSEEVRKLGLGVTPSLGNFILIRFPAAPHDALAADRFLSQRGILLRQMGGYGLGECLRATIGTEEENRLLVAALREFLGR